MHATLVSLLLFTLVVFSQQDEESDSSIKEKLSTLHKECGQQNNVNNTMLRKAFEERNFPEDKNFQCYFKCFFQKLNMMNDAGEVNLTSMKEYIPPIVDKDKTIAAIDKCNGLQTLKGSDACQTAFNVAKCLHDAYGPLNYD
ncbi:hypothetical protein ILUMI_09975 [Ignelater luminosus]|uniref:Uncharacterized protein n=1 Tax=Ignelater luminosus TaxID=2038154 RepID=A0A8K0CYZ5_IGNLU|nr:hypothetical protein ILUMI_09975 [Ignelater luminosus]